MRLGPNPMPGVLIRGRLDTNTYTGKTNMRQWQKRLD